MEKRVAVLTKELYVLRDVAQRDDLPRILHGSSQVLPRRPPHPPYNAHKDTYTRHALPRMRCARHALV